jgi:hypothetical protein
MENIALTSVDSTSKHGTDYKSRDSLEGVNTTTDLNEGELLTVMRGWAFAVLNTKSEITERAWAGSHLPGRCPQSFWISVVCDKIKVDHV